MPHDFKAGELTQFEQYTVDSLDDITKILDKQEEEKLPQRVQALESDAKWHKKIAIVIGGIIGGVCAFLGNWFFNRKG